MTTPELTDEPTIVYGTCERSMYLLRNGYGELLDRADPAEPYAALAREYAFRLKRERGGDNQKQ